MFNDSLSSNIPTNLSFAKSKLQVTISLEKCPSPKNLLLKGVMLWLFSEEVIGNATTTSFKTFIITQGLVLAPMGNTITSPFLNLVGLYPSNLASCILFVTSPPR